MSEKVSTITLRLTAEEAAQLEILKDIIGKKSGSEAIKYVVKEYPPILCALQAGSPRTRGTETEVSGARRSRAGIPFGTRQAGEGRQGERTREMIASRIRSGRSWPMKDLLSGFSGSCTRAAVGC